MRTYIVIRIFLFNRKTRTLLAKAHENINNTLEGVELIIQQADSGTSSTAATLADYAYFEETDALKALNKDTEAAYDVLWAEIVKTVPELDSLGVKLKQGIRDSIESVVWPGGLDFSDRYNAYTPVLWAPRKPKVPPCSLHRQKTCC